MKTKFKMKLKLSLDFNPKLHSNELFVDLSECGQYYAGRTVWKSCTKIVNKSQKNFLNV